MKAILLFIFLVSSEISFGQNADINLLRNINLNRSKNLDKSFIAITNSTYPVSLAIPIIMFGTGYLKKDSLLTAKGLQIGAAIVVSAAITEGLKLSINRTRPFITYPYLQKAGQGDGSSFPSGHVSIAFATATSVSLLYPKWYVIVPSYLWAGTIAYSRMDLGVHYPSDVLGGVIVGAGSSYLTYKANHWLQKQWLKIHH